MPENDFPSEFPIFPLPDVVLFPHAQLPLHIFEPRYRVMTAVAMEGDRVIGMVLLQDPSLAPEARAPIYPVGCAGLISEVRELPDGRFNLLLRGARRFRIQSESLCEGGYRQARTHLLEDPPFDCLAPSLRGSLATLRPRLEAVVLELARQTDPSSVRALAQRMTQLDSIALIHALCFGLDCPTVEKQSLLEAPDPLARGQLLLRLLAFHEAERQLPESPKIVN